MKSNEEINKEIEYLEKKKQEWASTRKDKNEAQSLSTKIYMFYQSIESRYSDYFDEIFSNIHIKVLFEDSLSQLNSYYMSKLKQKDDIYFYDGVENSKSGINHIIYALEKLLT